MPTATTTARLPKGGAPRAVPSTASAQALDNQALVTILESLRDEAGPGKASSRLGRATVRAVWSADQAHQIVKGGISSSLLEPLARYLGLGKGDVADYVDMDRTTVARKVSRGEVLPTHAAETVLRMVELGQLANDTFETPDQAGQWLRRPHPMLEEETPLECAKSAYGGQRVKDILLAIRYGGVV